MGDKLHKIDTFLLTNLFHNNAKLDHDVSEALLDWHSSLESSETELTREKAQSFLSLLAKSSLKELHLPEQKQEKLIKIFEPLERIFRLALSLSSTENIRDHLSHTIRNYLFSNYILSKYKIPNSNDLFKQLTVATIFHDIAYPIEKCKKGTKALMDPLFRDYLDSKSNLEFELIDPTNLLEILDVIGKSEHTKLSYIYRNIVAPAIAGKGLFDAPHCLCSVILFLRPIIIDWKDSKTYWETKSDEISAICLSMAFHDRKMLPDINLSHAAKSLRIADELQEWGRDQVQLSYIKNVELIEAGQADVFLHLKFMMKDHFNGNECDPVIVVADKLIGLLPISDSEKIVLSFKFPRPIPLKFHKLLMDKIRSINFFNLYHTNETPAWNFKVTYKKEKGKGKEVIVKIYQKKAEIIIS